MRGCILVVDDDPDVAETLRMYLTSRGFTVETAEDGTQAGAALSRHPPQVVVTDVRLPDVSGEDVARWARAAGARVVALTGEPDPAGEYDLVLHKPCSPRIIVAAVESLAPQAGAHGTSTR